MPLLIRLSNPLAVTNILVQSFITLSSNSSGQVAATLAFDLGSSGLANAEYVNYLSYLWTEARIRSAYIQVLPYFDEVKSGYTGSALAIATNLNAVVTPTTLSAVLDNGDARLYNVMNDTSPGGFRASRHFTTLNYASVSSMGVSPTGGAPGSFIFWGNQYPSSTVIAIVRYKFIYQFRNRA